MLVYPVDAVKRLLLDGSINEVFILLAPLAGRSTIADVNVATC
jgi:hypothetical protein